MRDYNLPPAAAVEKIYSRATYGSFIMFYTVCYSRHPTTRLGRLMMANTVEKILQLCDEFLPGDPPEYFFDRNPVNFPTILNMYRSVGGHLGLVKQKRFELKLETLHVMCKIYC